MVDTWKRLAYKSLGSGESVAQNTTWSTDAFTKCKNLKLIVYIKNTGSIQPEFFFGKNGTLDTDNNYLTRLHSKDISGDTSDTVRHSQDSIETERSFSSPFYATFSISNESGSQKLMMGHCTTQEGTNVSSRTARYEVVGRWTESTEQINMIAIKHSQGGSLAEGSYMLVLGNDSDTVSDEKTTLADATVTTDSPSTTTTTTSGATQQGSQSGSNQTTAHVTSGSNTGLKFTSTHSGTGAAVGTFDLGSALASKWIAQVSFTTGSGYTSSGNGMFAFGISDKSTYSSSEHMNTNSSGDTVNWIWHLGASNDRTQRIRTILNGSGSDGSNGTSRAWEDSTTFYFEMSYDGSTVTVQRKTDNTYATNHSQSAVTKATSGITGLQYFNWGSTDNGGSQGGFNVTLNTLKIYDDTDSLTTTTSLAPPVNTRYEETDTRKIYRFTSSGTQSNTLGSDGDATNHGADLNTTDQKLGTGCLDFETGNGDYINATNLLTNNAMGSTGTISFWIKPESLNGAYMWSVGDSDGTSSRIYIEQQSTSLWTVFCQISGDSQWKVDSTGVSFSTGTWYHVVITHDGGSSYGAVKLYINGVDRSSNSNNGSTWNKWVGDLSGLDNMAFGRHHHNNLVYTQKSDGLMDDMGVWNRALTQAEVTSLYNSGTGRTCNTIPSGLRAYYDCNSATVTNNTDTFTAWKERGSA